MCVCVGVAVCKSKEGQCDQDFENIEKPKIVIKVAHDFKPVVKFTKAIFEFYNIYKKLN